MNAAGQTICLNMIVKNEAAVIRRCLDSVLPVIDRWVIVDTGSSDGTQDIIREHLQNMPGELHERPWRDFAANRTEALELARGKGNYTLIIDADDEVSVETDAMPELTADSYTLEIADSGVVYRRPQILKNALPFRYEGVLHEYVTCAGAGEAAHLEAIRMLRNHDGARRRDPEIFRRDAALLEDALKTETSPFLIARYRFYLAQSYHDCGEHELALANDLIRAELGFWDEEIFMSLYRAARTMEKLGRPAAEVIAAYLRAADSNPRRAEALHGAAKFCRLQERYEEGFQIAGRGLGILLPPGALFVEPWIYDFGLLDEFAINAFWCGHYKESLVACLKILETGKLVGTEDVRRIAANARFAFAKL